MVCGFPPQRRRVLDAQTFARFSVIVTWLVSTLYAKPENPTHEEIGQIRIAFDGDAVLFLEEAERVYQCDALEAFVEHEKQNAKRPLPEGPFANLLKTLSHLQSD